MFAPCVHALAVLAGAAVAVAQTRLLRFPDLHGEQVVFTYAGDLWRAPLAGGTAVRVTSARGVELFAKYSPDGRWIAFTGQLDGDEQVCIVPSDGGDVRQLTWYPARGPLPDRWGHDQQVCGWTPDGSAVLFRSLQREWSIGHSRLYTVALPSTARQRGALPVPLPMPMAGNGEFAPDGNRIVYSPLCRDFHTWKRYQGGQAQDLVVFDPLRGTAENITQHARTDRDPMWIDDRIWFCSDRSGTLNLWSYDTKTKSAHQETDSTKWDVRWPSAGGPGEGRIVYEQGGELFWFDCARRTAHAIPIRVPDEGLGQRPQQVHADGAIEHLALSPGGRRAAFGARGEVLTVPREHGDLRNLTRSPAAHDKHPAFAPDGSSLAFVSDRSGEEQLWLVDHKGEQAPRQLTQGLAAMLHAPKWSPDGRWLLFGDKDGVLRLCEVASGELRQLADDPHGTIDDACWSPCSGHVAFSLAGHNDCRRVHVYSLADRSLHAVSRPLANDRAPAFDARGERLFFLGLRGFQPRLASEYEWDFQVDRAFGVFALALQKGAGPLLQPRSDEAPTAPPAAAAAAPTFTAPIAVDFDGLAERVEALPVTFDDYASLQRAGDLLLLRTAPARSYGRASERKPALQAFSLADRTLREVHGDVQSHALSPDGSHVLVRSPRGCTITDLTQPKATPQALELHGLPVDKLASDEYWQIFHEVWRRYRDFFYVANRHGHDWEALRQRYAELLPHVRHRSDLNYVLGEMIAELNVSHAYISGGDLDAPPRPAAALLGLVLVFDAASGRYRIDRVLRGENDDEPYRSPATALGVDLRDGDYVLAIDGEPLQPDVDPYRLLRGKAGRSVRLTVNGRPQPQGERVEVLQPIASEQKLFYLEWVEQNRRRVEQRSEGKLGYVHLPDMGQDGIREFIKHYYPQRDKQGLVIDDRSNGGGNVSQMVLNRLQRQLLMCTFGRTSGFQTYPRATFLGHLVCLIDEGSSSDGDIFPAMFRQSGLGKLIGKRTWGGIVGITDRGMLMDGGTVNVPEFGNTEPGGAWTIEGHGVEPDLVVDNDVAAVLAGRDPQLEAAIDDLLGALAREPRPVPVPPPPPVKTGR